MAALDNSRNALELPSYVALRTHGVGRRLLADTARGGMCKPSAGHPTSTHSRKGRRCGCGWPNGNRTR